MNDLEGPPKTTLARLGCNHFIRIGPQEVDQFWRADEAYGPYNTHPHWPGYNCFVCRQYVSVVEVLEGR